MIHDDKRGQAIHMHSIVDVDEPSNSSDCHQNAFRGTVVHTADSYITVEDQDGNCFDILPDNLEVIVDPDGEDYEDDEDDNVCKNCGVGTIKWAMVDDIVGNGIHEEPYCTECGPDYD